jgi:2,3-dihydroxyphenylpropionate 1,2-dioxygenase
LHYPAIHPHLIPLTQLLHKLSLDAAERQRWHQDPTGYAASTGFEPGQQKALAAMDQLQFAALGVHPLVSFLAHLQIDRERKQKH